MKVNSAVRYLVEYRQALHPKRGSRSDDFHRFLTRGVFGEAQVLSGVASLSGKKLQAVPNKGMKHVGAS